MHFAQYYLDCLSQASYLIGDETTGRAVLVDPRRDIDDYLHDAEAAGLRIELVIETHIHADFLSGHLELARATGATIAFGEAAETGFPIRRLRDGEHISLGAGDGQGVTLTVLATPGHTLESICLVLREHPDDEVPYGVLTGDTLFVGDVGRPDLLSAAGHTPQDMAARLHHSLHTKLLALPDATRVFPAHGAGSACGRNLSSETSSTIGDQRRFNYALQPMPEADFIRLVTAGQPTTPGYFAHDAALNRDGHPLLEPGAAARPHPGRGPRGPRPAGRRPPRLPPAGRLHPRASDRLTPYEPGHPVRGVRRQRGRPRHPDRAARRPRHRTGSPPPPRPHRLRPRPRPSARPDRRTEPHARTQPRQPTHPSWGTGAAGVAVGQGRTGRGCPDGRCRAGRRRVVRRPPGRCHAGRRHTGRCPADRRP
ncbi:MBL fold metallo-hydrolase [Streptomyces libani]